MTDRPAAALTEERIAHLRRWDELHGLDMLKLCSYGRDAAAIVTNWDSIRDGLHEALNEVGRLRGLLGPLVAYVPTGFDMISCAYCIDREQIRGEGEHAPDCPWLLSRAALAPPGEVGTDQP